MKKFLKVSCFVIIFSIFIFHKNNVYELVLVHPPELQLNMITEFRKEIDKAADKIQKLQEQIRQTKALTKSVKDESITEDMIYYADESSDKCSYKVPNIIVLLNFPSLSIKLSNFLCKKGQLFIYAVKRAFWFSKLNTFINVVKIFLEYIVAFKLIYLLIVSNYN